jgi:predicted dinucleotide-binding enzyme
MTPLPKPTSAKTIEVAGFLPVDLGSLDVSGPLTSMPFGVLAVTTFVAI